MAVLDLRRIRLGIEISGSVNWYEGLNIRATGTKYANPTQNECTVTIHNLRQEVRNYLLTETSPFNENRTPKRMVLEVGRQSGGMFQIYVGDITQAEPTQPPDIALVLKSKTQAAQAGNIVAKSAPAIAKLSDLTRSVASDLGLVPQFEATDVNVANFSHSGSALQLVNKLQELGNVRAYIDDGTLVVKDRNAGLAGRVRIVNKDTGMVGLPRATEKGAKVTFTVDGETVLGGMIRVQSQINPALDGDYVIDQLSFDVASHDDAFFYTALGTRA